MSVFRGLLSNLEITSSKANIINTQVNYTDATQKVSSVYAKGSRYFAFGYEDKFISSYPLENKTRNLLSKTSYTYSVVCKDAVSKEIIDPSTLTFEVLYLNNDYNYSVEKTASAFNLTFSDIPSDRVIRCTLRIKGSSYLVTYAQIASDPKTTKHTQEIGIVSINNAPDGVGIGTITLSQDGNGTIGSQTLTIPSSASKYEYSSFEIPAGTKFYDKNGNRLVGDINIKIGHFSPTNPVSFSLFNTGWIVNNISINGVNFGDNESVMFISGGFFSIDVTDSSGNTASDIGNSTPIKVVSSINPILTNNDTKNSFVVGDTMPVWRLGDNGIWENTATAVVKNNNGLIFEFNLSLFSTINLDSSTACSYPDGRFYYVSITLSSSLGSITS